MINLHVDEAYAFDYLSILEVKKNFSDTNTQNFNDCKNILCSQLGEELVLLICASPFYLNLVNVNQLVFSQIERIRAGESFDAKEVDDANMLRFRYKKELQKEFFNASLLEQKTKEV